MFFIYAFSSSFMWKSMDKRKKNCLENRPNCEPATRKTVHFIEILKRVFFGLDNTVLKINIITFLLSISMNRSRPIKTNSCKSLVLFTYFFFVFMGSANKTLIEKQKYFSHEHSALLLFFFLFFCVRV